MNKAILIGELLKGITEEKENIVASFPPPLMVPLDSIIT